MSDHIDLSSNTLHIYLKEVESVYNKGFNTIVDINI